MSKILTKEQLVRSQTEGCVFPVRIMEIEKAHEYRSTYEAIEARKGKDVPELLSVKPHILFPWLFELATTPTLLDAMEDLLGPNLLLTTCAIWPKKANDPSFVTWHQDSTYFGYDPMDEDFDVRKAINVELEPGECTIHHFRLAHSSEANLSDRRRIGILFVFCPPYVKPTNELNSGILVRGEDEYGYWKSDPLPKTDLDPANLVYYEKFWRSYVDPENVSEIERAAAAE